MIAAENKLPGGGRVRLHTDLIPTDKKEYDAAVRNFENVLAYLISSGGIKLDGIETGDAVECRLMKGGEGVEERKGDTEGAGQGKACRENLRDKTRTSDGESRRAEI